MGILLEVGKTLKKGLEKKKAKKSPPKKKNKSIKSGPLGSGAAQKAVNKLKSHEQRTHDAIREATNGKERKEMKGRR